MNRILNATLKITNVFTANRRIDGPMLTAASLYPADEFNELNASGP
jgi:hypothetical protein